MNCPQKSDKAKTNRRKTVKRYPQTTSTVIIIHPVQIYTSSRYTPKKSNNDIETSKEKIYYIQTDVNKQVRDVQRKCAKADSGIGRPDRYRKNVFRVLLCGPPLLKTSKQILINF